MKCAYGPHVRFMNITGMYMKCTDGPNVRFVYTRGHLITMPESFCHVVFVFAAKFLFSLNVRSYTALALYRDDVRLGSWLSALVGHGHSLNPIQVNSILSP